MMPFSPQSPLILQHAAIGRAIRTLLLSVTSHSIRGHAFTEYNKLHRLVLGTCREADYFFAKPILAEFQLLS